MGLSLSGGRASEAPSVAHQTRAQRLDSARSGHHGGPPAAAHRRRTLSCPNSPWSAGHARRRPGGRSDNIVRVGGRVPPGLYAPATRRVSAGRPHGSRRAPPPAPSMGGSARPCRGAAHRDIPRSTVSESPDPSRAIRVGGIDSRGGGVSRSVVSRRFVSCGVHGDRKSYDVVDSMRFESHFGNECIPWGATTAGSGSARAERILQRLGSGNSDWATRIG